MLINLPGFKTNRLASSGWILLQKKLPHFIRYAGHEGKPAAAKLQGKAGRRAPAVIEPQRALRQHGLLAIGFGHGPISVDKKLLDLCKGYLIKAQRQIESLRHRFSR